jgi:hypothetical protein
LYINAREECSYINYFNPLCSNKDRRKLLLLLQSAIVCDVIKSCQTSNPINFAESSISNKTKVCVYVLCLFHCLLKFFFFKKCDVFVKSPKTIFQISIQNLKFPANNSKQDSDLEYLFWRFEKHISLSEKTSPKGFSASKCDEGNWILSKS